MALCYFTLNRNNIESVSEVKGHISRIGVKGYKVECNITMFDNLSARNSTCKVHDFN